MKNINILVLGILMVIFSCTTPIPEDLDNDQDTNKPQVPEILDSVNLSTKIDQTIFSPEFITPLYLPNNKLLLFGSTPWAISSLFNYDLQNNSIEKWDEVLYSDLRYSTKALVGNNLIIISRNEEIVTVSIDQMKTIHKTPIKTASNEFVNISNLVYYKNYEKDTINIIQHNTSTQKSDVVHKISRESEIGLNPNFQFSIYQIDDNEIGIIVINKYGDNKYYLENINITKRKKIWIKELDEFQTEIGQIPIQTLISENKVYILSDNFISCREIQDGRRIWQKSKTINESLSPVKIFQGKLINVTSEKLEAYDCQNGNLIWELKEYGGDGFGIGWSPYVNLTNYEDYLFLNHHPININTGELLWAKEPELDWDTFDYHYAQPAVDLNNKFIYLITNNILYKLKLPEIK
ncbi:MAG: hypothetical protein WAT26_03975 [Saprospiraceae bacterium]